VQLFASGYYFDVAVVAVDDVGVRTSVVECPPLSYHHIFKDFEAFGIL